MTSIAFVSPGQERHPKRWMLFEQAAHALEWSVRDLLCLDPGDVVVTWNRHGSKNAVLDRLERRGIRVAVVENGYTSRMYGRRLTAFAWRDHGTIRCTYVGDDARWQDQGIDPQPWRRDGSDIVVMQQRSIGRAPVASPAQWAERTAAELKRHTKRTVRIRQHPGRNGAGKPLEDDLQNAWCVVTWASSAAIRAMILGVPCFHAYSRWIARDGAKPYGPQEIERPFYPDVGRLQMLRAISWAQWTDEEIAAGLPLMQPMAKVYG